MRFSLLALIGFVALAAVGCAALVNANDTWLVGVSTGTFIVVTIFLVIGLFGQGPTRSFAGGFVACSLAYLALIYFGLDHENGRGTIATTRALTKIWSALEREVAMGGYTLPNGQQVILITPYDHFMQIGQQLWSLLIGCLGGVFASWLWRRRQK